MKSSAVKRVSSISAPRILPELLAEVRKRPKTKKRSLPTRADSVIDQVRVAFSVSAIGLGVGILIGSAVPLTTFMIAHYEWKEWWSVYSLLVIGGLIFSAKTVFIWGKDAFRDSYKALGFILLIEGVMVFSGIRWINLLSLSILIGINAISTGANLVLKPPKKPSWDRV